MKMSTVMMENERTVSGQVLKSVDVKATLKGLLSEVSVKQFYENRDSENIEAVYTIPLPMDAMLLELKVRLNDEELVGVVKARNQAERD
jgi:Ca-activated chloride channel homolog